jgi:hypothetical protein
MITRKSLFPSSSAARKKRTAECAEGRRIREEGEYMDGKKKQIGKGKIMLIISEVHIVKFLEGVVI